MELFKKLFKTKEKRMPRRVRKALDDYEALLLSGCMKIPCTKCKRLVWVNEHYATCPLVCVTKILIPEYRKEVDDIRRRVWEREERMKQSKSREDNK